MNVAVIGGGPGGLYLSISLKLRNPEHRITIYERNRPDDTFGWGVVFSDQTLANLELNDPVSAQTIRDNFAHWDDIEVRFKGSVITTTGHGFVGIGRLRLLNLLQERARELGVEQVFEREIEGLEALADADLIVAADGLNSRVRTTYAEHFEPDIDVRSNRFIWLGTACPFPAFTFLFEDTPHGWIQAHCYRFDDEMSTFIVECRDETWRAHGCDRMNSEESIAFCERIFARDLGEHRLISNASHLRGSEWIRFPRVSNGRWHHDNIVLLGDAAHTAHFSIGSGTKLALEDAIDLARLLEQHDDLKHALDTYEEVRRPEVLRLQSAARNSTEWFESVARYTHMDPPQFTYSLLTRSQRVSHENLRLRDRAWLEDLERWFARRATGTEVTEAVPPMFTPFKLRDLELRNRVVVSPMAMYSAVAGAPSDFHLVHLGARALGGAAMVFTEMTCVAAEGRITPGCAGLYDDAHVAPWKRIVDFVHGQSSAKIALQLGHAGPKGSTKVLWEGMDEPLPDGNWPLLAPSSVRYTPASQEPRPMTRDDMAAVTAQFVRATELAARCDFDLLELHCAHGYLLSAFITPLTNHRTDAYGGSLDNRLRFPLEVFAAMRATWPQSKPMSVRISATDWVEGGVDGDEAIDIARAFRDAGADIIDVSAGQTSRDAKPVYGRMFQTPFSDRIRNEVGVPTMAVGNIYEADHVNGIIAAGRADLCCLARPHLSDPNWTLRAAAELGVDVEWPRQYAAGKAQLERNLRRQAEMATRI